MLLGNSQEAKKVHIKKKPNTLTDACCLFHFTLYFFILLRYMHIFSPRSITSIKITTSLQLLHLRLVKHCYESLMKIDACMFYVQYSGTRL